MFRESSLVLYRDKIIDYSVGSYGEVEFNFENIWPYIKECKKKEFIFWENDFHFFHVHPGNTTFISETDINCIKGFSIALGKNISNFHIVNFLNDDLYDYDYKSLFITSYFYYKESGKIITDNSNLELFLSIKELGFILFFLKQLSFGDLNYETRID